MSVKFAIAGSSVKKPSRRLPLIPGEFHVLLYKRSGACKPDIGGAQRSVAGLGDPTVNVQLTQSQAVARTTTTTIMLPYFALQNERMESVEI